uniref:MYND-type domain-containing protein n=1 Tax=Aureoumbra lagunensis TaxID=44058 RepID=A0A7S3NEP6_9STRA
MNDAFLLHPRSVYGGEEGNGDEKSDMIRKTGCPPTRKNEIENSLQALLNTTVLGRGGINDEEGSLQNLLAKSPTKKTSNIQLPKRASKSRLWHDFNGNDAATDKDSDVFASLYDDLKEGSSAKMSRATTKSKHNITPSTNQSKNEKEEKAALPKARKIKTDQAVRLQKKSQQCNNWICEKQGTFRCGKCASRWYCSRTCQKNDWINVHRAQCVKKSTTQESQIIRDRSQSVALARQDEALRELKGVDYVIFEDVNPRTGRTCEEIHIRLPNMGAKILSRLCRLKAAESHLFFLKKLYKLFIDYAPQYTIRIRSQLQAEYNVDPHSPAVQRSNDQNSGASNKKQAEDMSDIEEFMDPAVYAGGAHVPREITVAQCAMLVNVSSIPKDLLATLRTVLMNVHDKTDAKYRRIKLEKVRHFWYKCEACRSLLQAVGWEQDDEFITCVDDERATILSGIALRYLSDEHKAENEPKPNTTSSCAVCSRRVSQYHPPPRGGFFRRARANWEGVVCTTCAGNYTLCGGCYNIGQFGSHDPTHTYGALGWWDAGSVPFRPLGGGAPHRPRPSPSHGIHGRRGPWG